MKQAPLGAIARVEGVNPLGPYHLSVIANRDHVGDATFAVIWGAVKRPSSVSPLEGYKIRSEGTAATIKAKAGVAPVLPSILRAVKRNIEVGAVESGTGSRFGQRLRVTAELGQTPARLEFDHNGHLLHPVTHTVSFQRRHSLVEIETDTAEGGGGIRVIYPMVRSANFAAACLQAIMTISEGFPDIVELDEAMRSR